MVTSSVAGHVNAVIAVATIPPPANDTLFTAGFTARIESFTARITLPAAASWKAQLCTPGRETTGRQNQRERIKRNLGL